MGAPVSYRQRGQFHRPVGRDTEHATICVAADGKIGCAWTSDSEAISNEQFAVRERDRGWCREREIDRVSARRSSQGGAEGTCSGISCFGYCNCCCLQTVRRSAEQSDPKQGGNRNSRSMRAFCRFLTSWFRNICFHTRQCEIGRRNISEKGKIFGRDPRTILNRDPG